MFALNWQLTLIDVGTLPVLTYVPQYFSQKVKVLARTRREKEGRVASRVSEMLSAVSLVQVCGRQHYEEERFETESAKTLEENIQTARIEAAAVRSVEMVSAVGTWAVVFSGLYRRSSVGIRPTRRSSIDLVYHCYLQHKASEDTRDAEIGACPSGRSKPVRERDRSHQRLRGAPQCRDETSAGLLHPRQGVSQSRQCPLYRPRSRDYLLKYLSIPGLGWHHTRAEFRGGRGRLVVIAYSLQKHPRARLAGYLWSGQWRADRHGPRRHSGAV
jgi:ABC transporter transmembrane region